MEDFANLSGKPAWIIALSVLVLVLPKLVELVGSWRTVRRDAGRIELAAKLFDLLCKCRETPDALPETMRRRIEQRLLHILARTLNISDARPERRWFSDFIPETMSRIKRIRFVAPVWSILRFLRDGFIFVYGLVLVGGAVVIAFDSVVKRDWGNVAWAVYALAWGLLCIYFVSLRFR
jgi:hypothetical protein